MTAPAPRQNGPDTFNYNPEPVPYARRVHHAELVPDAIKNEERWCTPCRGLHEDGKIHAFEPYTVLSRLKNLGLYSNDFSGSYTSGVLPVKLSYNGDALVWAPGSEPKYMDSVTFIKLFSVIVDGLREQHEQYRYVAFKATLEMIDAAAERGILHKAVPNITAKLRLALNTLSPHFVALALYMVRYVLKKTAEDPRIPAAMLPEYAKLLPPVCRFARSKDRVHVPPKGCLVAAGRWESGTPSMSESAGPPTVCAVCGKPCEVQRVQKVRVPGYRPPSAAGHGQGQGAADDERERFGARPATAQTVKRVMDKAADGRKVERFVLRELVDETLRDMCRYGGPEGRRIVKKYHPTHEYVQ